MVPKRHEILSADERQTELNTVGNIHDAQLQTTNYENLSM